MELPSWFGPAAIAAAVSGAISLFTLFVGRSTSLKMHKEKLAADERLAERKFEFDQDLAERKFQLDIESAERKKRQDLAEEVLAGFYEVKAIMQAVRSPGSFEDEARDRVREDGENQNVGRTRDAYFVPLARLDKNRVAIVNLLSRQYRMVAWFGADAEAAFKKLDQAIVKVQTAAQLLLHWTPPEGNNLATEHRQRREADIWAGDEPDPVGTAIAEAVSEMEAICRPVLSQK